MKARLHVAHIHEAGGVLETVAEKVVVLDVESFLGANGHYRLRLGEEYEVRQIMVVLEDVMKISLGLSANVWPSKDFIRARCDFQKHQVGF